MADEKQLVILRQGASVRWNVWRQNHPDIRPDLRGANLIRDYLHGADLHEVDLRGAILYGVDLHGAILYAADLRKANLRGANLGGANLGGANLGGANLGGANLNEANLSGANLTGANLSGADLSGANLSRAKLGGANLQSALLVKTRLENANLRGCRVYGMSAWNLHLEGARQADLIITTDDQPEITVDNLEVAQFIHLLLNNERIRHVIDTITSKVVLILGRFTPERKAVLDALRDELRKRDFTPVLFDFEKPAGQDLLGTIETLARMSRFVIADITEASSIPAELQAIVPHLRTVPVRPLLRAGAPEYALFAPLRSYPWVLEAIEYRDVADVRASLERIIAPAEAKAKELRTTGC